MLSIFSLSECPIVLLITLPLPESYEAQQPNMEACHFRARREALEVISYKGETCGPGSEGRPS